MKLNTIFKKIIAREAVLILFYDNLTLVDEPIAALRNLAAYFGKDVSIVKIVKSENEELSNALRIKSDLTYFIYSNEQMILRLEEKQSEQHLKELMLNLLLTTKNQ